MQEADDTQREGRQPWERDHRADWQGYRHLIATRLPAEEVARLDARARAAGLHRSVYLAELLRHHLTTEDATAP